jgi:ElaB/YqjD/DUF883 family membrane-anchored ribosome-binding protein
MAETPSAASDLQSKVERLRAELDALIERGGPAVADAVRQAGDVACEQAEALAGRVRTQPLTAVLIAAGLGYVLGRLMR